MVKASHIATSKFKREKNGNPTICFKEERDEITVNIFNDYDNQHGGYILQRKLVKEFSHTDINSLRGLYRNLLEPSILWIYNHKMDSLVESLMIKFSDI